MNKTKASPAEQAARLYAMGALLGRRVRIARGFVKEQEKFHLTYNRSMSTKVGKTGIAQRTLFREDFPHVMVLGYVWPIECLELAEEEHVERTE